MATHLQNTQFEGQRQGEEVLLVFRRHIIAMRKGFLGLLVPFAISAIPPLIWQTQLELFLLPLAGLMVGGVIFAYHFIIWYFSIFILTDQRLRQVTQQGMFGSHVIEIKLAKINAISYQVPGFSGELFGFGTLVIQTYVGDLVIHNADHPHKLYNILQDAADAAGADQKELYEEETSHA